ncbi:MAG: TonB-dependent receptor [Acidobacteria bacterium]|nr:TonB-dependent receptor [Acidobacteriota bacterium]
MPMSPGRVRTSPILTPQGTSFQVPSLLVDVFNLFGATDSDIDYDYGSRLPNEPLDGVNDIDQHPTLRRRARVNIVLGF